MIHATRRPSLCSRQASLLVLAWLIVLAALWPGVGRAQPSAYCPTLSATVPWGGAATIDVTACDGPFDGGMSGPIAPFAQHGTVAIGPNDLPGQFVTYAHNGLTGSGDTFALEDNELGVVTVNITIAPPATVLGLAPATLPAMTAGTPFSQALTSTGGTAPYTYSIVSGALPQGLSLTAGGVVSGTPTQRGIYSVGVRSQDAIGAAVVQAYTGIVQNPDLSVSPGSGTAIQGVFFSQALTATGGVAPHTFQLESGTLPSGITISGAGVVSGTTSAAPGNYLVTLRVADASTGPGTYFELVPYTLTVSPPPSVSISVSPAAVAEDGATNLIFTVTRSLNLSSPTLVNLTTTGTATAGNDYAGAVTSVGIPAGATTASFAIDPTPDGSVEPDETVIVAVAAGSGYTIGAPAIATGTILNDDVPTATISVAPAAVAEDGAANLVYTVALSQAAAAPLQIAFTVNGTATSGSDYAAVASPLLIPAGATTGTIVIDPTPDIASEADETVVITLDAGTGYTVGTPSSATGTILNDDLPTLVVNDVAVAEGNAGTTNATFTVALSQPAGPGGVTFDIATADGTATAGADYAAASLTGQAIAAGSSTYAFTVQLLGDTLNEPNETFFVNVTNVTGAVVGDGQGLGTIANDDALPQLSIGDASVAEGNSGTVNATFTVTLDAASGQTVTVNYATSDGTAVAPGDYVATNGNVVFAPGQTTRTITVAVVGDTVPEANETFTVQLSGATNATIARATATGTIVNDDVPISVTPATLPSATVAAAYAQNLGASGGTGPYTFAVTAGALPAGVTLASGGALGGTPNAGGTFNFTVTATDNSPAPGPFSGSQAYALVVNAPVISLAPPTLANATAGTPYSASITASGGTSPYTFAVTAGSLPAGVTLSPSGVLAGTPTATGAFNFTVTATDASTGTGPYAGTQAYTLTVDPAIVSPATSTVTANPTIVAANGIATSVVTVTARDAGGNPLAGRPASLSQGSGASTISPPTVTDASGVATFTVSDATAESVTYSAIVDGVTIGQTAQVDFLATSATGATPNGDVTASITGGSCIGFAPGSAQFSVPPSTPPGRAFPYGVFGFRALGCGASGSITITFTFPNPVPPGAQFHKLLNGTWVDWTSRVAIAGNTIVLTIADGGEGDTDPAAGVIADPSGLTVADTGGGAAAIPTLSGWGMAILALLMFGVAASVGKQRDAHAAGPAWLRGRRHRWVRVTGGRRGRRT